MYSRNGLLSPVRKFFFIDRRATGGAADFEIRAEGTVRVVAGSQIAAAGDLVAAVDSVEVLLVDPATLVGTCRMTIPHRSGPLHLGR